MTQTSASGDRLVISTRTHSGLVTTIALNRGAKRNALSPSLLIQLRDAINAASQDESRVIVLRSTVAGVFSAGFDIMTIATPEEIPADAMQNECSALIENGRKVSIAFTDGLTIGGGLELFLACDLRIATSSATFRMPPVKLARTYYQEGIARFVRTVGLRTASEMLLTARQLDAMEAQETSLLTRIVADAKEADAYIATTAECPPYAQQALKAALRGLAHDIARPPAQGTPEFARIEHALTTAQESEDAKEALRAFGEKRPPRFTGR